MGCYYDVCVFLGANTNPYGFGAGECTTGENIWKKALKLLNSPCPKKQEHEECEWCAWGEMEE